MDKFCYKEASQTSGTGGLNLAKVLAVDKIS